MRISVNGASVELPEGSTLADALAAKSISPAGIATAVNGAVIPGVRRSSHRLTDGDNIVIIKAFYGG